MNGFSGAIQGGQTTPMESTPSQIPIGLAHGEGVGQMTDFPHRFRLQEDLHDIEADFDPRVLDPPQVIQRCECELALFLLIDGCSGPGPALAGAGFDLHEHQAILLLKDQVDFTPPGAKIGDKEFEPQFLKILSGRLLPEVSPHKVAGQSPVSGLPP